MWIRSAPRRRNIISSFDRDTGGVTVHARTRASSGGGAHLRSACAVRRRAREAGRDALWLRPFWRACHRGDKKAWRPAPAAGVACSATTASTGTVRVRRGRTGVAAGRCKANCRRPPPPGSLAFDIRFYLFIPTNGGRGCPWRT